MTATTTQGTGPGSVENSFPRILNRVKTDNLADHAVTLSKLNMSSLLTPVSVTSATVSLNSDSHANRYVVLNRAAGITVTLPAATGTGNVYKIMVGTTVTSNSDVIKVANATDVMAGLALGDDGDGEPANGWATTSTTDTVTMDGTTTGGVRGDYVEIADVSSGLFHVRAYLTQGGSEATPFSATVS